MCGSGAGVAGLLPNDPLVDDVAELRRDLERLTGFPPISTESLGT
jgi:hypothetical protein